jgi:serine/threonine-protein kinase HipA
LRHWVPFCITFAYLKYAKVKMSLYLVGENIDKARAHYRAETGQLTQLVRGIYVDPDDDADATVLRYAVRIAKYLYPRAYLSAASSVLLGPTRDGRLFLSARRIQRTRIRALEIIQNQAPSHPSIASAIVADGISEFRIDVSSIRQRFLEAFRLRSEHAASIDDAMRDVIAARLIEEYGTAEEAAKAIWALARENDWLREGEGAERYLLRRSTVTARNEAALDLIVAWHREPLGHLRHDGFEWRWAPLEKKMPPLIRQTTPGKLPPFIVSLLPEGWLESVLKDRDERAALRSGKRYMSNITIVENEAELKALPEDILTTRLAQYSKDGIFTGTYGGPGRGSLNESFERNLARMFESKETPRLSGIQIKAPLYLDQHGKLLPATDKPFTHILKPAGTSGYEALPIVEWLALALGRACGFEVPDVALINMPDSLPPALIVERFDIRSGNNDTRMLALEDFCSVLGVPTEAKYDGTIDRMARQTRPLSTEPDEDVATIIRRSLFAWLIADGDMHLKNIALLKIAEPGEDKFKSVRMAPMYDAVTTRVFPNLAHDRMALKLNGKDDKLKRVDFKTVATRTGLKAGTADEVIDALVAGMRNAVDEVKLPILTHYGPDGKAVADQMLDIARKRLESFN